MGRPALRVNWRGPPALSEYPLAGLTKPACQNAVIRAGRTEPARCRTRHASVLVRL